MCARDGSTRWVTDKSSPANEPDVGQESVMAWFLLVVAGMFETGFAVFLKQSHGITRLWPTVGFAVCALISFALLTVALESLEVGPAYAAWTGLGAAGTAAIGMLLLGDKVTAVKLGSIAFILVGVIGLNLSGVTPPSRPRVMRRAPQRSS